MDSPRTPHSGFRHRLSWRLCALFVAGALLPVALSDWLFITVTNTLAAKMDADRRIQAVRAVSRQVLERVRLAEAILQSRAGAGLDAPSLPVLPFDRAPCTSAAASSAP